MSISLHLLQNCFSTILEFLPHFPAHYPWREVIGLAVLASCFLLCCILRLIFLHKLADDLSIKINQPFLYMCTTAVANRFLQHCASFLFQHPFTCLSLCLAPQLPYYLHCLLNSSCAYRMSASLKSSACVYRKLAIKCSFAI
jgi:hypothetical protein